MTTSPLRILAVDDEPQIQNLFKALLSLHGHEVVTANNGLESLTILSKGDFDIIFMDIRMNVMDGLTTTKFIRSCEQGNIECIKTHHGLAKRLTAKRKGSRIPVIAITANLDYHDIVHEAGMDGIIQKPFNFDLILKALKESCSKPRQE